MQRSRVVASVFGGVLASAGVAHAQSAPPFQRNIDLQAFRPAPGPNNFLTTDGARVDGDLAPSFGAFANYSFRPFTIYDAVCPNQNNDNGCTLGAVRSRPVEHMATLNLLGSLTLFRRLQIGIDIPVAFEMGDAVDPATGLREQTGTGAVLGQSAFAVGDPRLTLKVRILGGGLVGPALAAAVWGQAPLGQAIAHNAFLGDNSAVFGGRLIFDYRTGPFALAVNGGVAIRPEQIQILSSYMSNRIVWSAALSYDLTPRITGILEGFGSTDLTHPDVVQQNAVEGDLAIRYHLGDVALTAGGGAGIVRGVGVPVARGFLGVMYAPDRVDSDHDGIPDDRDRCPTQPEDRDGFQDEDGCPDPDNDQDGLLDANDHCPNEAEDRDHFLDSDGCPDRDNDNDGILDGFDSCPNLPEDHDGDRDEDGCPDNDRDRDGIPDERDQCPTEPEDTDGFQDEDGCPDPDNDQDGILDVNDQCSEQPETYNGYQDEDGCPDSIPDRDHDGIPDGADHCPDQPETYNGIEDEDGCPERGPSLVRIEGGQILILQQVNFATNSDRIVGAGSFRVLDAVAAVVHAHAELGRIEVQGHTDNRGNADTNRDLSRRRAAAVQAYLLAHGVDATRLESRGFGPDHPLAPNTNNRNRARNRRVEFHILGRGGDPQASGPTGPSPAPAGASAAPASARPAPVAPSASATPAPAAPGAPTAPTRH